MAWSPGPVYTGEACGYLNQETGEPGGVGRPRRIGTVYPEILVGQVLLV